MAVTGCRSRAGCVSYWAYVIMMAFLCGVDSQMLSCELTQSETTNTFSSYSVNVTGSDNYTLSYYPESFAPGQRLPVGTSEINVTATFASGSSPMTQSCVFNVTVNITELPIECPENNDVESTTPGESTFQYQPSAITLLPGYDYQNGFLTYVIIRNTSEETGNFFPVGSYALSVRYSDNQLEKTCNFTLIVVDTEAPIITCPEDVESNFTNVIQYMFSFTDNIPDPAIANLISYSPASLVSGARFPPGLSTVTLSLRDLAGNEGSCSFNVTISLQELPIVCPPQSGMEETTDPGQATYTYQPFAIEFQTESSTYQTYSNITRTTTFNGGAGDAKLSVGTNNIRSMVTDSVLLIECAFQVDVIDMEPPVIVCPDDIFEDTTDIVTFALSATDNAHVNGSGVTVQASSLPGFPFPQGTTVVVLVATDDSDNTASCSFNVTIDLQPVNSSTETATKISSTESATTISTTEDKTTRPEPIVTSQEATVSVTKAPVTGSDNLPLILGVTIPVVLLILIIIVVIICCNPRSRSIFGIGPKEPVKRRVVGASRHGVATDAIKLSEKQERHASLYYGASPTDMVENPYYAENPGYDPDDPISAPL
ncbi:hyalin-like [Diadema antillarum]|uniref:hyalin-like n=1 Tax=Diadema antillarum TaxID=105358 RepID=UPI003A83FE8B